MKYQLFATKGAWTTKETALEAHLGIPTSGTAQYASATQVTNEANADFGKWIMPAVERGRWKCDDQFDSSKLVEFQPRWFDPDAPPPE
jgi:hypothetical protein